MRHRLIQGSMLGVTLVLGISVTANSSEAGNNQGNLELALLLADVLTAARTEIASQQPTINNALVADKGLDGTTVLKNALERISNSTNADPSQYSEDSVEAKLLKAQQTSMKEIIDENQPLINKKGIGFKGFVPAVFAQLSNERFGEKVGELAEIKVTAPIDLVRNRKARPDKWERKVIKENFLSENWERGRLFSELAEDDNGTAFRVMVPEYYSEACLACHGNPKGETDITGYPKEGGHNGDLGGAISITLYQ